MEPVECELETLSQLELQHRHHMDTNADCAHCRVGYHTSLG